MKEKTADELFEELGYEKDKKYSTTAVVYDKQLKELIKSILKIPFTQRDRYMVICKENVYKECKKIVDYFEIKTIKSDFLPDDILIVLYKNENLGGVLSERK